MSRWLSDVGPCSPPPFNHLSISSAFQCQHHDPSPGSSSSHSGPRLSSATCATLPEAQDELVNDKARGVSYVSTVPASRNTSPSRGHSPNSEAISNVSLGQSGPVGRHEWCMESLIVDTVLPRHGGHLLTDYHITEAFGREEKLQKQKIYNRIRKVSNDIMQAIDQSTVS